MYSILDLNKKLVADLREIASVIKVNGADKLKKAELIEAILDEQNNHKENGVSEKPSDNRYCGNFKVFTVSKAHKGLIRKGSTSASVSQVLSNLLSNL